MNIPGMLQSEQDARRQAEITARIALHLTGLTPGLQSAVLADLTAMWLVGFQGPAIDELREQLLADHVELIRALVPLNEEALMERLQQGGRPDGQ